MAIAQFVREYRAVRRAEGWGSHDTAYYRALPDRQDHADLAVFNASLPYSTSYATTLRETLRVIRPGSTLVILDTPMYSDPTSGARMVQEREARFKARYGFASNALPHEHYLTP